MFLHLTGAAAGWITKLIESTNALVPPLYSAGISLLQLVLVLGMTSTAWHRFKETIAPLRVTGCPLPNSCIRLYGFSATAILSSLVWAICLQSSHILALHLPDLLLKRHHRPDLRKT